MTFAMAGKVNLFLWFHSVEMGIKSTERTQHNNYTLPTSWASSSCQYMPVQKQISCKQVKNSSN